MIIEKDHGVTFISGLDEITESEVKEVIAKLESDGDGKIISLYNIKEFQEDVFCPDERTMLFNIKNTEGND